MKQILTGIFILCSIIIQAQTPTRVSADEIISKLKLKIPNIVDTPATGKTGEIFLKPSTNQVYIRNGAATAWILVNSAGGGIITNLYTTNGTLTGNRVLFGAGYTLYIGDNTSRLGLVNINSNSNINLSAYAAAQSGFVNVFSGYSRFGSYRSGIANDITVDSFGAKITYNGSVLLHIRNIPLTTTAFPLLAWDTVSKQMVRTYLTNANIYNTSGTLTGARALTGSGNSLYFNGLSKFRLQAFDSVYIIAPQINLDAATTVATGTMYLDNVPNTIDTTANILAWNPLTHQVEHRYSSSFIPGFEEVITAGPSLTGTHVIAGGGTGYLSFDNVYGFDVTANNIFSVLAPQVLIGSNDSTKLTGLGTAITDTTLYKPVGISASGRVRKMGSWPGVVTYYNTSVGSGYRWTVTGNNNTIKTVMPGINILVDSATANSLTISADTTVGSAKLATQGFATRAIVSKLNISDTASMLSTYLRNGLNMAGIGVSVFKDKSGDALRFKRLKAGTGITITDNTDSVTIANTGIITETDPLSIHLTGTSTLTGIATVDALTGYTFNVTGSIPGTTAPLFSVTNTNSGGSNSTAILGIATANSLGKGVRGTAAAGYGIYGEATTGISVFGTASGSGTGIAGWSSDGIGGFFRTAPSSTNTVTSIMDLQRSSFSGVGANGIGGAITFKTVTTNGSNRLSSEIISELPDATDATRTSNTRFTVVRSATTVDGLVIGGAGYIKISSITATEASAITAADGMQVYVNSTNGTFTAVGFWGRENGTWVKL